MFQKTLILFFFLTMKTTHPAFLKKYNLEVESMEVCPDNAKMEFPIRNFRFVHFNRTHKMLNYDVTYTRPLDQKIGLRMQVDQFNGGNWKSFPFISFLPDACNNLMKHFSKVWLDANRMLGVEHPEVCPIPKGNYSMRNYVIDTSGIQMPMWGGRVRTTIEYVDSGTKKAVMCFRSYVHLQEII